MPAIRGSIPYSAKSPRGPWTRIRDRPADPRRGKLAINMQYGPTGTRTRDGFTPALAVGGSVFGMYHWITNSSGQAINRLIYNEGGTTVKMRNLIAGSTQDLFTQSGTYSFITAEAGNRLYIATFTSAQVAASKVRIVNALFGGVPSDFAFAPPMTAAPVITDTGAGQCTEGEHMFGYILETRTGFTGKPSPQPANVFTPVAFSVTGGSRSLNLAVTANTPADAAFLHPIMTRVGNPTDYYFVPDAAVAIPGGAIAWTANMTINISDEDLLSFATSADENFDYFTQDVGGSGPFEPQAVLSYGQRMVYLTPQTAYVSDIQDYQVLVNPESTIELPGQKQIVTGFVVRGALYLLGPAWTYGISDSGRGVRAREWGTPSLASGGLGTTAIRGVCARSNGDYAWVANQAGLYFFDGAYAADPISYGVDPEWRRINWGAPNAISVVDHYNEQKVVVIAPLDGATVPTHMLTFDYSEGFTWLKVNFSLNNLPTQIGSGAIVIDPTTGKQEFWVGPGAAGNIVKQSFELRNDSGSPISYKYETGLVINPPTGWRFNKCGAVELDITGAGNYVATFIGLNSNITTVLITDPLSTNPGDYPLLGMDDFDQNWSIRIEGNELNGWCDLARVTCYTTKYMTN